MKNNLLLPRICRPIGMILLVPFLILLNASFHNFTFSFLDTPVHNIDTSGLGDLGNNNLTDEFAITGCIISLFMIAFSRLKHEDEYIRYIRLQSLQIGVYAYYAIFILLTFTFYGWNYLSVLMFNIGTDLILFILVFNYKLYIRSRFTRTIAK